MGTVHPPSPFKYSPILPNPPDGTCPTFVSPSYAKDSISTAPVVGRVFKGTPVDVPNTGLGLTDVTAAAPPPGMVHVPSALKNVVV